MPGNSKKSVGCLFKSGCTSLHSYAAYHSLHFNKSQDNQIGLHIRVKTISFICRSQFWYVIAQLRAYSRQSGCSSGIAVNLFSLSFSSFSSLTFPSFSSCSLLPLCVSRLAGIHVLYFYIYIHIYIYIYIHTRPPPSPGARILTGICSIRNRKISLQSPRDSLNSFSTRNTKG